MSKIKFLNSKKIVLCLFLVSNYSYAQTYKFEITCTASVRYYCSLKSDCVINRDLNPSVYKIKADSPKSIKFRKFIGSENTSSWTAHAYRLGSGSDKYQFIEEGMLSTFTVTNDKRKFTHMFESGISLYNSDLSLKKIPDENLGGQIETGSCIPN